MSSLDKKKLSRKLVTYIFNRDALKFNQITAYQTLYSLSQKKNICFTLYRADNIILYYNTYNYRKYFR